jgi:hypothetical protein
MKEHTNVEVAMVGPYDLLQGYLYIRPITQHSHTASLNKKKYQATLNLYVQNCAKFLKQ